MPSGSKMRTRKNSSKGWPETTSTKRPSTSTLRPYSQRSPGLKSSGTLARRFTLSSSVPSYGNTPCPTFAVVQGPEIGIPVVGKSRGMPQQVANRNFSGCGNGVRLARGRLHQNFGILELGQVLRDGVFQKKTAFLVEHHYRHAGYGLGHGADAEHGVGTHRFAGLAVHHALRLDPRHVAAARHQRDGACNALVIDNALDGRGDPVEPIRRQADAVRLYDSQVLSDRNRAQNQRPDENGDACLALHQFWKPFSSRTSENASS